ncbi:universal stress protein [Chloroflexota bacterium]
MIQAKIVNRRKLSSVADMYRQILVPLDGSRLAEVALPYAEEVAAKTGADIIFLSVLDAEMPDDYQKHQAYIQKVAKATRFHAEKYLEEVIPKPVKVMTATRRGSPANAIVDYANKGAFKLIIMATHGRSGISRWAVGSVADKVVRATTRQPILLIRANGAHPDVREKRILKKMLVPLDGSTVSRAVVPYISELAVKLEMEVTFFQVVTSKNHNGEDAEEYLQSHCAILQEEGIVARCEVRTGDAAEQIIDFADEMAMDLVAMSTHGKSGLNFWTLGSVAQKVLLGGTTPLLLMRA